MTHTTGRVDAPGLAAPPAGAGSLHVPGPVDRVHFLDEQRRYRNASRRFTLLAMLAVLITGIPACIVVTPLVFTIVLTAGHIVNGIAPIPPETWAWLREGGLAIPKVAEAIDQAGGQGAEVVRAVLGILVLVLPGALTIFVLWLVNRRLLGHVAVGHALERAGAREPNERDLEERQLRRIVSIICSIYQTRGSRTSGTRRWSSSRSRRRWERGSCGSPCSSLSMALIGPIVAFMWRTRRHLADAMAVQLTRNPDALARALRHFGTVKSACPSCCSP